MKKVLVLIAVLAAVVVSVGVNVFAATVQVPAVTGITISDVSNYDNAKDVAVKFTGVGATNEKNVKEYRVYLVKAADEAFAATPANLLGIQNTTSDRYYVKIPKRSKDYTYYVKFPANTKDIGDAAPAAPITNTVSVKAVVVTVGVGTAKNDGSDYTSNVAISAAGKVFSNVNNALGVATSITATDVADNSDGSDVKVSFVRASNDAAVKEYAIILSSDALNLAQATTAYNTAGNSQKVPASSRSKVSGKYTKVLAGTAKYVSSGAPATGTAIGATGTYKVYILSIPKNNNIYSYALSTEDVSVTLTDEP